MTSYEHNSRQALSVEEIISSTGNDTDENDKRNDRAMHIAVRQMIKMNNKMLILKHKQIGIENKEKLKERKLLVKTKESKLRVRRGKAVFNTVSSLIITKFTLLVHHSF